MPFRPAARCEVSIRLAPSERATPPPRPDEFAQLAIVAAAGMSFVAISESIEDKVLSQAVGAAGVSVLDMVAATSTKLRSDG